MWQLTRVSVSCGRCATAGRGRAAACDQVRHIRHDVGEKGGHDFMSYAAAEHMPYIHTADVCWVVKLPATCCWFHNISLLLSVDQQALLLCLMILMWRLKVALPPRSLSAVLSAASCDLAQTVQPPNTEAKRFIDVSALHFTHIPLISAVNTKDTFSEMKRGKELWPVMNEIQFIRQID